MTDRAAEQAIYVEDVINDVWSELRRAHDKHGFQGALPDIVWAAIAGEEAGEATKAALEEGGDLYGEVIQAATMYIEWAANLRMRGPLGWRETWPPAEKEEKCVPR